MPFLAYDLSLELAASCQPVIAVVRKRNANLAKQLDEAVDSVHQNLAEAGGRHGDDRVRLFRYSYGSLREVRGSLELAVIKGFIARESPAAKVAYRLGGMLWRLARL